jgi:rubrerythrin
MQCHPPALIEASHRQQFQHQEENMNKTIENLKAAFTGESEARNKYTFFAEIARKEGYLYIAKLFEETAENERQHAKDHLLLLGGWATRPPT